MKCNFDFCLLVFFFNTVQQSVSWQKWWTDKLVCRNCWLKGMMLLGFWRADWTHLTWQTKCCQENPGIKHPRIQHASMVSVHGKWEHKILERIFSLKFKWMLVKLSCLKLRNDIIWIYLFIIANYPLWKVRRNYRRDWEFYRIRIGFWMRKWRSWPS